MESTWESRDLPVLEAIVKLYEAQGRDVPVEDIAHAVNTSRETVEAALRALKHSDVRYFAHMTETGEGAILLVGPPTGHARRTVGAWPTPEGLADRIIAALNEAAENESDDERKGRLRRAADAVGGVGKGVLTEVMTKVITRGIYGSD